MEGKGGFKEGLGTWRFFCRGHPDLLRYDIRHNTYRKIDNLTDLK